MEDNKIVEFISIVSEKNVLQAKALNMIVDKLSQDEKNNLTALLNFYNKERR